ncbi:HTH-type transcriptional regulator YidZ [Aeromonas allosaccharophila]|uniref:HTH-type transcriptional regulator YidZ n=1 Tax=Aeromonas allosaccharophila TaxID=656 RepID=UPI003986ACC5
MRALSELDLNLLVVFKYLMAERSATGAATLLGVTPSTVSKSLAKLRLWFGDPLFVRGRKELQPTNLAFALEEELKLWFPLTERIASLNSEAIPDGARFSLVMQSPFYNSLLSDLPMAIHEKYPNSVVKMLGWNRNSLNDVVNGDADLGVCVRESYSRSQLKLSNLPYYIDHEVLFCDRPVVFLRKDHPLLQQEWSMENFLNCPHSSVVLEVKETWGLDLLLEDEGLIRKVPVMVSSFEQSLHIASQPDNNLIAVAPSYCAGHAAKYHPNLITRALPLSEALYQQLELTFILLWHKRHNQDAKVLWLLNEIRRLYHRESMPVGRQ